MHIIYSGGYNKHSQESINGSFIYTYKPYIQKMVSKGKKVGFVTLAKPDGYYDELLTPVYGGTVEIINSTNVANVKWSDFNGLFLMGGSTIRLLNGLKSSHFFLDSLKKDVVIHGDSAGAYILSSFFYIGEYKGQRVEFFEGFNPQAKVITIAHTNNPDYCNDDLILKVNDFALKKGIHVLKLAENEQKIFMNGKFVDVDKALIFT